VQQQCGYRLRLISQTSTPRTAIKTNAKSATNSKQARIIYCYPNSMWSSLKVYDIACRIFREMSKYVCNMAIKYTALGRLALPFEFISRQRGLFVSTRRTETLAGDRVYTARRAGNGMHPISIKRIQEV
jgi:hypothetical protein